LQYGATVIQDSGHGHRACGHRCWRQGSQAGTGGADLRVPGSIGQSPWKSGREYPGFGSRRDPHHQGGSEGAWGDGVAVSEEITGRKTWSEEPDGTTSRNELGGRTGRNNRRNEWSEGLD